MMSEVTLLESRVDKIERDNRRLKLALGALLLALAAVPLVGAVMPEQIPELIQARRFEVIDENGTRSGGMSTIGFHHYDNNGTLIASMGQFFRGTGFRAQAFGGLRLYDENGQARVMMDDYGISYFDENGTRRAEMSDLGIGSHDENGIARAVMRDDGISYWDENGNIRVEIGANYIAYGDENENLVWSTDCGFEPC
jgi:hypothetical protein